MLTVSSGPVLVVQQYTRHLDGVPLNIVVLRRHPKCPPYRPLPISTQARRRRLSRSGPIRARSWHGLVAGDAHKEDVFRDHRGIVVEGT